MTRTIAAGIIVALGLYFPAGSLARGMETGTESLEQAKGRIDLPFDDPARVSALKLVGDPVMVPADSRGYKSELRIAQNFAAVPEKEAAKEEIPSPKSFGEPVKESCVPRELAVLLTLLTAGALAPVVGPSACER